MSQLSNQPPKGTADWFPEEFQIRKYIFDTWRSVCQKFGYQEYLTPIVESAEVYRAKSGEDVGGKELMSFFDQGGRELAIRPEMTPSVTRMLTRKYESMPKPVRLFSIANFFRNEKPQRGRNREFWQLNFDVFGSDSVNADIEILQMAIEIMLAFNPPVGSFVLNLNNRKLIDEVLDQIIATPAETKQEVVRVMDKWEKMSREAISERLTELGLNSDQIEQLARFLQSDNSDILVDNFPKLADSQALTDVRNWLQALQGLGYGDWVKLRPNIIRGFDYYDGMVFEVFDTNPDNARAMFGGGRYNGLASLFGGSSIPAVGCAPGDETTRLFLESWGLLDQVRSETKIKTYYLPLLEQDSAYENALLAARLRASGKNVETGLHLQGLGKALDYADKRGMEYVVILGADETARNVYAIRNMQNGEQLELPLNG